MRIYAVYYSHPISHRDGVDVQRDQVEVRRQVDELTPEGFRIDILFPGRGEDLLTLKNIPLPPREDIKTGFIPGRRVTSMEIIERNFDDIDASDFVFCDVTGAICGSKTFVRNGILGPEHRSDGVLAEIAYARGKGKRGVLAMELEGNVNDRFFQSRMLRYREYTRDAAIRKMMMLLLPVPPRMPIGADAVSRVGFQ